jgi:hypothetical protein
MMADLSELVGSSVVSSPQATPPVVIMTKAMLTSIQNKNFFIFSLIANLHVVRHVAEKTSPTL